MQLDFTCYRCMLAYYIFQPVVSGLAKSQVPRCASPDPTESHPLDMSSGPFEQCLRQFPWRPCRQQGSKGSRVLDDPQHGWLSTETEKFRRSKALQIMGIRSMGNILGVSCGSKFQRTRKVRVNTGVAKICYNDTMIYLLIIEQIMSKYNQEVRPTSKSTFGKKKRA